MPLSVLAPDMPTPESIAAAKAAQRAERALVMAETGIVIDDEGRIGRLLGRAILAAVLSYPTGRKS